jgi:hypothetical protein
MSHLDPHRKLTGDVPCGRCSYNLRGLSRTGRCPECGMQVAESIRARLAFSRTEKWNAVFFAILCACMLALGLVLIASTLTRGCR